MSSSNQNNQNNIVDFLKQRLSRKIGYAQECLIIFARYPEIGKVKTRLVPTLGAETAALLYQKMAEHTLEQAKALRVLTSVSIQVWFTGGSAAQMQAWLGDDLDYQIQPEGDLGDRLAFALQFALSQGNKSVVIIGTDCPELNTAILDRGFRELEQQDLVLGVANDGGYYLIGLKRFIPELFSSIPWSTSEVLQKTVEIAKRLELTLAYLPTLTDIDTAEDLVILEKINLEPALKFPNISVIMPTLNEAENLTRTLKTVHSDADIEVIVVDGGSSDDTVQVAESWGAKVISSSAGRSHQMNLGASFAKGDILLFLHADTCLPANFAKTIRQTLAQSRVVAGAFELKIDSPKLGLRWVEWGVRMRSQLFQMPYGDQAIFLKTSMFQTVGGFPSLPIMEDFELICQLQKKGKIAIAAAAVLTSSRRWQKLSVFRTTLINQLVIIGYLLGVSASKLAHWYRNQK